MSPATHWKNHHLASDVAMGGGGRNLPIGALDPLGEFVVVIEDFNQALASADPDVGDFETSGWVVTDVGIPVANTILANVGISDSRITLFAGTSDATGNNLQLTVPNQIITAMPGMNKGLNWGATVHGAFSSYVYAARVGLATTAASWVSGLVVGMAAAETAIMTAVGALTAASWAGPGFLFHFGIDGTLDFAVRNATGIFFASTGTATRSGAFAIPVVAASAITAIDLCARVDMTSTTTGSVVAYARPVRRNTTGTMPVQGPWSRLGSPLSVVPSAGVVVNTIELTNGVASDTTLTMDWYLNAVRRMSLG